MSRCRDAHHGLIHWLVDNPRWAITITTAALMLYGATLTVALLTL